MHPSRINIIAKNGLRWASRALRYEALFTPIGRNAVLDPMKNSKVRRSLDSASKSPCHPENHGIASELGLGLKSWGQNLRVPQGLARISTIIEQRETFELVFLLLILLSFRSSLARGLQPLTALGTRLPWGAIRGGNGSNHLS